MHLKKYKLFFIIFYYFISCNTSIKNNDLKEGDLLFQNLDCGPLCEAIESVTKGIDNKDFSHCALVVKINDSLKVVEAIGDKVQLNSIENFYKRSNDTNIVKNITVGRLKNQFRNLIPQATKYATAQLGVPYDDEFIMNNNKLYCSELFYESFKNANNNNEFFTLNPMTFKAPKTNIFFPSWVDYYKDLNKPIPEGQLGINPGLISLSNKIDILK